MVDLHLTEEEQTERIKAWWKQNGVSIVAGVVLGLGVIFGVDYWRDYRQQQAETASSLFQQMISNYESGQVDPARTAGDRLRTEFADTPYGGKAALMLARIGYEQGEPAQAEQQLRWALANAVEPATRHAARLRLARLLLSQDKLEEARSLSEPDDPAGFVSDYHELRGDIALAQGQPGPAQEAYRAALDTLAPGSSATELLTMKLESAVSEAGR